MRTLYFCDHEKIVLPPGHKFPAQKYELVRALISGESFDLLPAPPAAAADIELAHDPAYVRAILDGSVSSSIMRRIGFPWSDGLVRRTLGSVGGTIAAARDAMRTGF